MAACLGAAAIAGCAGLPPPRATTPADGQRSDARPYHDAIALNGRLSVRYQQNGQDEALHGGFGWQQQAGRTAITLQSPTGQTLAAIDVTPTVATLSQAGRPVQQADDIDQLTAQALGWPLPVSGMRQWLQGFGVAQDGSRFVATPAGNQTITTQDGWQVRYDAWQPVPDAPGSFRPRRIDLERLTSQAGPVALRIVIDQWQPLSP